MFIFMKMIEHGEVNSSNPALSVVIMFVNAFLTVSNFAYNLSIIQQCISLVISVLTFTIFVIINWDKIKKFFKKNERG